MYLIDAGLRSYGYLPQTCASRREPVKERAYRAENCCLVIFFASMITNQVRDCNVVDSIANSMARSNICLKSPPMSLRSRSVMGRSSCVGPDRLAKNYPAGSKSVFRLTKAAGPPSWPRTSSNASVCRYVFSNAADGDLPIDTLETVSMI